MRLPTLAAARRAALGAGLAAAAGLGAAGCKNDVNVTDPNALSSGNFWKTAAQAQAGLNAAYAGLLQRGVAERWQGFAYDMRSDLGTSTSPWAELQAFVKFSFPAGYDFEVNREIWNHSYTLVSRINQVTDNVPGIQMDEAQKNVILGEAKFLRGVAYFHLISLFGGQIPLITTTPSATDRPASSDSATVYAQIEKDLTEAAAALPIRVGGDAGGRASKGAAQGMLGKVQLQERKWSAAAATLAPVASGQMGAYDLVPNYATLFTNAGNNSVEALFEVQMGNVDLCGQGICGQNVSKMIGPCGPSYCDGLANRWYLNLFLQEPTTSGGVDPRLNATLYYYRGDTTRVYNRTWGGWRDSTDQGPRYQDTTRVYWKKFGEYYTGSNDQTWEAQINYKILRFADVLLMYAEALNESGQTAAAYAPLNRVRARAQLAPFPAGASQEAMRAEILKQRALEFGLEGSRWLDLGRQGLFTSDLAGLKARDPDFNNFVPGKSELLPITQAERDLNPNVRQNPGY